MLYAITDTQLTSGKALFGAVESALRGGCRWLQYRDKSRDSKRRLHEATQLQNLCEHYSVQLIINDDVELALVVGASGVHLGQGDGSLIEARQRLGHQAIIGSTCHNDLSLARNAVEEGASYVAFGRLFTSTTKPDARQAELSVFKKASNLAVTTVGIGGIHLGNTAQVIGAGANVIAVCHSLFACEDIEARARAFCEILIPKSAARMI